MPIYLYSFLFLFVIQTATAADSTAIVYAKGMQAQADANYRAAIKLYESILDGQTVSSGLYNNLGLAYINDQQLGKGILQFERALKVDPNNQDARHNLKAAQQRIEERYAQLEQLFFIRWWNTIVNLLSSTGWAILFLLLLCLGATGIGAWRINQKGSLKTAGILILIGSILPLIWGFQQKAIEQIDTQAIIIKTQVGLRQDPALSSKEIELVFEGLKVDIIEEQENWTQIKLSNSLIGWIPSSMLERI